MRNLFILAIILTVAQACDSRAGSQSANLVKEEEIPVALAPILSDSSRPDLTISGVLNTEEQAMLSFKIGGVIDRVLVKEDQPVKKGQLLATLKQTEISSQEQQVRLSLEKAQRDYDRAYRLWKDSVATLEQLQNAKTGLEVARQSFQQVSFNRKFASIYASADGFVERQMLHEGEVAAPGSPVLLMHSVSPGSRWILQAGVSDQVWSQLMVGDQGGVSVDAYPGKFFHAVVSKKSLSADPVTGSFRVELKVDFGKYQPALGMFGKAILNPSRRREGFAIPYEALLEANGKKGYVFVTDDRKVVKKIPVEIASITDQMVFVSAGLEGHSFLVVSGSPYLSDNSRIKIID